MVNSAERTYLSSSFDEYLQSIMSFLFNIFDYNVFCFVFFVLFFFLFFVFLLSGPFQMHNDEV